MTVRRGRDTALGYALLAPSLFGVVVFLLLPMLVIGMAAAVYWLVTERAGAGNVVPYGILQAYAVVMLLAIAWLYPSRYTRGNDIYWVFTAYVMAKVLEAFDKELLAVGHLVSGHTLKHVAAAIAGLVVPRMLVLRRRDGRLNEMA